MEILCKGSILGHLKLKFIWAGAVAAVALSGCGVLNSDPGGEPDPSAPKDGGTIADGPLAKVYGINETLACDDVGTATDQLAARYLQSLSGDEDALVDGFISGALLVPRPEGDAPSAGRSVFTGPVLVSAEFVDLAGETRAIKAEGRFAASVGHASEIAVMQVTELSPVAGAGFNISEIVWQNLGVCGAKIGSTGAGQVSISIEVDQAQEGAATIPETYTPVIATFEAAQFVTNASVAPPFFLGGTFNMSGDSGTITAVFRSESQ